MAVEKVCRTCLKQSSREQFHVLSYVSYAQAVTLREKLKNCVPEMNISDQENADICAQCVALLESAYIFRTTCLNTERQLKRISSEYYSDLVKIMKKKRKESPSTKPKVQRQNTNVSPQRASTSANADVEEPAWTIQTRRKGKRTADLMMPTLEAQEEAKEDKKAAVTTQQQKKRKRLSDDQMLKHALKSIPELKKHTKDMLDCRVSVEKLPTNVSWKGMMERKESQRVRSLQVKGAKFCTLCKKWFSSLSNLEQHQKARHSAVRPYICYHCNKPFASKTTLAQHISQSHRERKPTAATQTSAAAGTTVAHKTTANISVSDDPGPPVLTIKPEIDSSVIVEEMPYPPDLIPVKQERPDPDETPHASSTPSSEVLVGDDEPLLLVRDGAAAEEPVFHCRICGEMFPSEKDVHRHKETHAQCRVCQEVFATMEEKDQHEARHYTPVKGRLFCLTCKLTVRSKDHFNLHSGLRPFSCDVCDKTFTSRSNLQYHRYVHSEQKPFHCPHCNRGFMKRKLMLQHKSKCPDSPKKRSAAARTVPNSPNGAAVAAGHLQCEVCKKNFEDEIGMRAHVCMNAEGERVFRCHICEVTLVGRKDFIAHVKRHFVEGEGKSPSREVANGVVPEAEREEVVQ